MTSRRPLTPHRQFDGLPEKGQYVQDVVLCCVSAHGMCQGVYTVVLH